MRGLKKVWVMGSCDIFKMHRLLLERLFQSVKRVECAGSPTHSDFSHSTEQLRIYVKTFTYNLEGFHIYIL